MNYYENNVLLFTAPDGFHKKFYAAFTFTSNGYFSQCPNGHTIIVMRSDGVGLNTSTTPGIHGQGMIFGNVFYAPNGIQVAPGGTQIETWFNNLADPGSLLLTPASGNPPPLLDGTPYTIMLMSDISEDRSTQTIRYLIWNNNIQIYDSGYVNDPNKYFDATKNSMWIGHVFDSPGSWSVSINNLVVVLS